MDTKSVFTLDLECVRRVLGSPFREGFLNFCALPYDGRILLISLIVHVACVGGLSKDGFSHAFELLLLKNDDMDAPPVMKILFPSNFPTLKPIFCGFFPGNVPESIIYPHDRTLFHDGLLKLILKCCKVLLNRSEGDLSSPPVLTLESESSFLPWQSEVLLSALHSVLKSSALMYDMNYDIARVLLKYSGLSEGLINLPFGPHQQTALHAAVSSEKFELVWLVSRFGAKKSLTMADSSGYTPFQLAGNLEHCAICTFLLEEMESSLKE